MKSHTEYLWFKTENKREYVNITPDVEDIVADSRVEEGLCLVSAMHITASIFVNDDERGFLSDLDETLEELAPEDKNYMHNHTSDPNGDAHQKRTLVGHQVTLPITKGRLDLGPWEQVFYGEFDGRRKKRVIVKIIGE